MICRTALVVLVVAQVFLIGSLAAAATVKVDLLGGIGDFDYSGDTHWYSGYTGSDYDFDADSGWTTDKHPSGWRYGYDPATPDNSVAVGWIRRTGPHVHPRKNVVYRIEPSGTSSGNRQFFGLRRVVGDSIWARLETDLRVRNDAPTDVHVGDTVTFRVDTIRMSGYSSLPSGSKVEYRIGFNGGTDKALVPSDTAFADEISMTVPASLGQWLTPYIKITSSGPLGDAQPGVFVDGAHVYIKRASDPTKYATWDVPVTPNKGVKTLLYHYPTDDLYSLAKNSDGLIVSDQDGALAARIKYLNPSIKTYLYQIYTCLDWRDSRGIDPWYSASPTQFGWAKKNNRTGWLFPGGSGKDGFVSEPSYPYSYYMRVTDKDYQAYWAAAVKAKLLKWKHDGVFMDSINPLTKQMAGAKTAVPQRDPSEVQSFLHATVPLLKKAGTEVAANVGGYTMLDPGCSLLFNPHWSPTAPYTSSDYTANQPLNTPNIVFQEWGFIRYNSSGNVYDPVCWLKCLKDMDAVKNWNTLPNGKVVPAGERVYYSVQVLGVDKPSDPASGVDGWCQFGLASYLLGQNDWTWFSWYGHAKAQADIDYASTAKLGPPEGDRASIGGDSYFVYRKYKTAGGGSAVVVVNANTTESRNYTVPSDVIDESGAGVARGSVITLKPHTGRILIVKALG